MEKGRKKFYNDIILILVLLITALSVFIIWRVTRDEGVYASVIVENTEVARYPLSVDGEYSLNGGTNTLVISGGKAHISAADCPDGVCIRTGKISLSGERIVCLPNKLEIRIIGEDDGLI